MAPDFERGRDVRDRLVASLGEFLGDDQPPRRSDTQAMGERLAAEIDVDERDDGADLRQAEPDGEIFRAIGHHQADRLAGATPALKAQREYWFMRCASVRKLKFSRSLSSAGFSP